MRSLDADHASSLELQGHRTSDDPGQCRSCYWANSTSVIALSLPLFVGRPSVMQCQMPGLNLFRCVWVSIAGNSVSHCSRGSVATFRIENLINQCLILRTNHGGRARRTTLASRRSGVPPIATAPMAPMAHRAAGTRAPASCSAAAPLLVPARARESQTHVRARRHGSGEATVRGASHGRTSRYNPPV